MRDSEPLAILLLIVASALVLAGAFYPRVHSLTLGGKGLTLDLFAQATSHAAAVAAGVVQKAKELEAEGKPVAPEVVAAAVQVGTVESLARSSYPSAGTRLLGRRGLRERFFRERPPAVEAEASFMRPETAREVGARTLEELVRKSET